MPLASLDQWTVDEMYACLDPTAMKAFDEWGNHDAWVEGQIELLRQAVDARLRAHKVCDCGRYKSAAGAVCRACRNVVIRSPHVVPRPCAYCGVMFVPKGRKAGRFCGVVCAGLAIRLPDTLSRQRLRERRRKASEKRRMKGAQGGSRQVGRWRLICERDGWVCWICLGPIDSRLCPPHKLSGTCDHVIPLSVGGSDNDDNVRAAHLTCNVRRWHAPDSALAVPLGAR